MNTVISVEHLSKSYRLGQIGTGTFAHDLHVWWAKVRGKPNPMLRIGETDHGNREGEELWALKDVSFTVEQGEVLGIIGRNGAGKSTLLKILSRVTAPTSGKVKVKGRIASLLEVGTGFHPELTGRENIYLNGAILGMSRQEVSRKFDEIVDFSGVEKFIDTPVKRYSSGMYVRLAFAVAAHLDPEILVVDEVLAVGDAEFQKKCIGKMGDVAKEGRTVLFVSHNLPSVKILCSSGIVMDKGRLSLHDSKSINSVLDFYNSELHNYISSLSLAKRSDRRGNQGISIISYELYNEKNLKLDRVTCGEYVRIRVHYKCQREYRKISVAISFGASAGENKLMLWSEAKDFYYSTLIGDGYFDCIVDRFPLTSGVYFLSLFISSPDGVLDWIREAGYIDVVDGDYFRTNKITKNPQATVLVDHLWE